MASARICAVFILVVLFLSSNAFAVTENECLNMTKRALLQIWQNHSDPLLPQGFRNWDGTFTEGYLSTGQKTITAGNITFFCRGGLKAGGKSVAGATLTVDGITVVGLDRNEVRQMEDYKAITFHEMVHAGVAVQVNKTALSALNVYSGVCDETLAHAKTLLLLQSLNASSPEFGRRNLSKSMSYQESMKLLEYFLRNCMKVTAATDQQVDDLLLEHNLKPEEQKRAKEEYKRIMKILREELDRIKAGIMEKKIKHMRSDGRISADENRTLEGIRAWLNVSQDDYRSIYNEIAFADLPPRCEGPLPASGPASGIASQGLALAVTTATGDRMNIYLAPENEVLRVKPQFATENTVELSEDALSGIVSSLDRMAAIQAALGRDEIAVKGPFSAPASLYGHVLRVQQFFSPPFSPGTTLRIGQSSVALSRSAHGLTLAKLPGSSYNLVLNRYGGVSGCTTSGAMRLAGYKPQQLSPSAGLYIPEWDPDTHRAILDNWPSGTASQMLACGGNVHAAEEMG